MTKTFAERCHIAQQFLPDAQYKAMLTALHEDMLAKLAEQPAPVQKPVVFYRCNGCGHAYEQVHPTSCDCMMGSCFEQVNYYTTPQPAPAQQEPLTNEHLKAYGYAPGGYMMTCRGCNTTVTGVDKRASRCMPCATKAAEQPAQQEPYGWHTEDHLTDRSATTYSKDVADRWRLKGWPVTPFYTTPQAQPAPEIAIADAYRAGVDSGIAAEREACAKVCDDWAKTSYLSEAKSCAKIIRARGNA